MRQNSGNMDIRQRATAAGIRMWELAKAANIAEPTLTRWMREDLPLCDPRRTKLLIALSVLEQQAEGVQHGKAEKVDGATV